MAARTTALQEAEADTRRVRYELGREIRGARVSGGSGLRLTAQRVGMSHAQLGRIERGVIDGLTVDQLSRACLAVGLRLVVRAVPGTGPLIDAGQLALIGRLRRELPPGLRVRTEVPLPIVGDRRAWDLVLGLTPDEMPVEAEARLRDIQAVDRRCALKRRDAGIDRMVLLVSDTANNRRALEAHREDLRTSFPLDTRKVMSFLRAGKTPEASGIVVL